MSDDDVDWVTLGGWDPRYARILVVVTLPHSAVVLVDPNGDGADIDTDVYERVDGEWRGTASGGGAGDGGSGWSHPGVAYAWGLAEPGATVRVAFGGDEHEVVASEEGRWMFAVEAEDGDESPRVVG